MATIKTDIDIKVLAASVGMSLLGGLMRYYATMVKSWYTPLSMLARHTSTIFMLLVCLVIVLPRYAIGPVRVTDRYNLSELTADLIGECVTYVGC